MSPDGSHKNEQGILSLNGGSLARYANARKILLTTNTSQSSRSGSLAPASILMLKCPEGFCLEAIHFIPFATLWSLESTPSRMTVSSDETMSVHQNGNEVLIQYDGALLSG